MRYATEHDRLQASLDRQISQMREAGASLGSDVIDTAELFIRNYAVMNTAYLYTRALFCYFTWCVKEGVHPWKAKYSHAGIFAANLLTLSAGSRRNYLVALRSFYRHAMIEEVITRDPFHYVRTPSIDPVDPTRALTKDELQAVLRPMYQLIKAGTATLIDRRDFELIALGSRTGARLMSLRSANWGGWAYRGSDGILRFMKKGGGAHSLVLGPEDAEQLEEWRAALTAAVGRELADDDPLFPFGRIVLRKGKPTALRQMSRDGIRAAVKGRYLAAGLRGTRLAVHVLRATSATIAHENDATTEEIQRTGGWKSPEMVDLYIKRNLEKTALRRWSLDLDDLDVDHTAA